MPDMGEVARQETCQVDIGPAILFVGPAGLPFGLPSKVRESVRPVMRIGGTEFSVVSVAGRGSYVGLGWVEFALW